MIWKILLAILIFSVMIFIHELGHFLAARSMGVGVVEFALGMGPRLISFKRKDTVYSLRAFPIGGSCTMIGEDETSDSTLSLTSKPVWKRFVVLVSGAVMNILLGLIVMLMFILSSQTIYGTTVRGFIKDASSNSEYGIKIDDEILKVNNNKIHTQTDLVYTIMREGIDPVSVTVKRDGAVITLTDVVFGKETEQGVEFGQIDFGTYAIDKTVGTVFRETFFRSMTTIKMIWQSLFDLIRGRYGIDQMSGPVGVTTAIGEAASLGIQQLLYMISFITINLGVFNLLPLPALDGGRIMFLVIELIRRKPVKPEHEGYVHFVGILLLFALMIFVTFQDIVRLIK